MYNIFYYLLSTTICLVTFIVINLFYQHIFWHSYWRRRNFPYLKTAILWGHARPILLRKMGVGELAADLYRQLRGRRWDYGGYYIFHLPVFMPTDPDLIKSMLIKDFHHFTDRGFYHNEDIDPLSAHLGE